MKVLEKVSNIVKKSNSELVHNKMSIEAKETFNMLSMFL